MVIKKRLPLWRPTTDWFVFVISRSFHPEPAAARTCVQRPSGRGRRRRVDADSLLASDAPAGRRRLPGLPPVFIVGRRLVARRADVDVHARWLASRGDERHPGAGLRSPGRAPDAGREGGGWILRLLYSVRSARDGGIRVGASGQL